MALLIYAHPYPDRSRCNRRLLRVIEDLPEVQLHSLYERYPDFDVDIDAERRRLTDTELIIWQHPMYWYSVPGLLKHWFDRVLGRGWAYGDGGDALHGKRCLWVVTTGGDDNAFSEEGIHAHSLQAFVAPVEQTARFCGMHWLPPIVIHGAHKMSEAELDAATERYKQAVSSHVAGKELAP